MHDADRAELESEFRIVDANKGDSLLHQGVREMEQYFVLDGILKRVVANAEGKEMILRFADAGDIETSYAAWRLKTPTPVQHRLRHQGPGRQAADAVLGRASSSAIRNSRSNSNTR